MADTKIEWTDKSWNPATGCTPISEGCANCYARRMARRLAGRCGYPSGNACFSVTMHPEKMGDPLRWRKPRKVFVCSMGDLFHGEVGWENIAAIFGVMAACPQHTFQVLTKRPDNMLAWFKFAESLPMKQLDPMRNGAPIIGYLAEYALRATKGAVNPFANGEFPSWPLPNVWLGISAENQGRADERTALLQQTPAAVRFVSVEPMLGPIYSMPLDGIDWVICGAETGPGARLMAPGWARHLRDQCGNMGVPFFFKKWSKGLDGGDMPREFPR